jgi:hypothetical protein
MKKFYLLAFLFFIMGVFAYSQETLPLEKAIISSTYKWEEVELSSENLQAYNARKKLFDFSVGIGGLGKYMFVNSYESAWLDYGMFGNLNLELFSHILFDASFNYFHKYFFSAEEGANCFGLDISLFWKNPLQITQSLGLYTLGGISYEMFFYMKDDSGAEYNREEAKDLDTAYLKIGGGFDYSISRHFRFNLNLLYGATVRFSVITIGDFMGSASNFYFLHGPNLSTGIRFVL